jgi:hypothetical protein
MRRPNATVKSSKRRRFSTVSLQAPHPHPVGAGACHTRRQHNRHVPAWPLTHHDGLAPSQIPADAKPLVVRMGLRKVMRPGCHTSFQERGWRHSQDICGLKASLCNRTSGAIPGRLSIASTSNRQGQFPTCRSPRNRRAVRTTSRYLSAVTLNSGNAESASRTVLVRTSTNANVARSYPIRSISPFAPRGM